MSPAARSPDKRAHAPPGYVVYRVGCVGTLPVNGMQPVVNGEHVL